MTIATAVLIGRRPAASDAVVHEAELGERCALVHRQGRHHALTQVARSLSSNTHMDATLRQVVDELRRDAGNGRRLDERRATSSIRAGIGETAPDYSSASANLLEERRDAPLRALDNEPRRRIVEHSQSIVEQLPDSGRGLLTNSDGAGDKRFVTHDEDPLGNTALPQNRRCIHASSGRSRSDRSGSDNVRSMSTTEHWHSEIDTQLGVPGADRTALAGACALEIATFERPRFDSPAWQQLAEHDQRAGFGSRIAARAILRRPSDGRFLIFRYPFRDGSFRFVIPGGGAEPGEDAHDTVTREVFEETGTAPRDLRPSGLLLYHLLASTIYGARRTPTIQYSPVLLGTIDDELPDTDGREYHWYSIEEFEAQPRRPISDPILSILRDDTQPEQRTPAAVWLPA